MRKLISMLLAVSMSLSVMCSSFTVAAVDGNEAAQTEGSVTENAEQPNNGIGGLFGNEINEKIAAQSNEFGISTVEVNGNIAAVKYHAIRDCTVIVGIYADDGTKGTHMVTFGTAQVKAAETETSVTIDNLPQYFYLKAYLVDSESCRPLSIAYTREYNKLDDMTNVKENMLEVEKSLQNIIGSDEYQNADVESRKEQMDVLLKSLKEQGLISDYRFNQHGNTYSFEYAHGGSGGVILEAFDSETDGFGDGYEEDYNEYLSDIYNGISTLAEDNTLGRKLNILLLDGFENIPKKDSSGNVVLDDRLKFYTGSDGIVTKLENSCNVHIDFKSEVTVQTLLDIGKDSYDIVVFAMHGICTNPQDEYNSKWGLMLNESFDTVENAPYGVYQVTDLLSYYYYLDGRAYVDVYSNFFGSNNTDWDAKIVYLSSCASFGCKVENGKESAKYASNFLSIPSVEAVVGYYNAVNSAYNRKILTQFITEMCNGKTVMNSIRSAMNEYGKNDNREDPNKHKYKSSPKMVGNPNFKFMEIIDVSLYTPYKELYGIGEQFNGDGGYITITYSDNTAKTFSLDSPDIAENIEIVGFDSSKKGTCNVYVKFTDENNNVFKTEEFTITVDSFTIELEIGDTNVWQADPNPRYSVIKYSSDGSCICTDGVSGKEYTADGKTELELKFSSLYGGGKVKFIPHDKNKIGTQKVTAIYCNDDGTPNPNVKESSAWISVHQGSKMREGNIFSYEIVDLSEKYSVYSIGESCDPKRHLLLPYIYVWNESTGEFVYTNPAYISYETDPNGGLKLDSEGNMIPKAEYLLSNATYLGGFDSSSLTEHCPYGHHGRLAYFEYKEYVFALQYKISETGAVSALSEYDMPAVTEVSEEIKAPVITEQDTTEPTVTEPQPEETTVIETSAVEEPPVMGNESTGVFGFGRAGKKTAQYANLHKNDIYNYYVVRSAAADILGKDNLLFVGQTSSDGNGSLSFEYETVTGEDGEIILKPMSDDPTTPDTPSKPGTPTQPTTPTIPDSSGSGNTYPSVVVPVGGTITETMTVKVENKVTGKKSKAVAKKTGSTVTVKLGTENNGYYANVYTTDDEFVASAIIENGRAKFNVPDGVKLAVVIDKISYGEDVSSAAGASADSESANIPYPVIITLIAVFGIYVKVGKKYLDQKAKR